MSELSPETRDLIARGRKGTPSSPRRRAAIHAAVLAEAATLAAPVAAATWTSFAAKIIVVASVAIAGTVGTAAILRPARGTPAPETRLSQTAVVSVSAPDETPLPAPIFRPQDPPVAKADPPPVPITQAPIAAVPITPVPIAPVPIAPVDFPPPPESRSGPSAPAAPLKAASSLEEEVRLLRDAHRALAAGEVDRSLHLLDEHEAKFPSSALEPERSAERVFALCQGQRIAAARTSADAFLARHGDGPLAARVRGSCIKQAP